MHRILLSLFSIVLHLPLAASAHINTEDFAPGKITLSAFPSSTICYDQSIHNIQLQKKKLLRLEKRLTKIKQRWSQSNQYSIEGFSDTTDRWFWLWTIGWGTGILITLLSGGAITSGFFGILWLVGFGFGSAALFVWLRKRFQ
jgi:hypothetical protein